MSFNDRHVIPIYPFKFDAVPTAWLCANYSIQVQLLKPHQSRIHVPFTENKSDKSLGRPTLVILVVLDSFICLYPRIKTFAPTQSYRAGLLLPQLPLVRQGSLFIAIAELKKVSRQIGPPIGLTSISFAVTQLIHITIFCYLDKNKCTPCQHDVI